LQITTILYIIIALLLSVAIAFFQYFYKEKKKAKISILLFFLKTISLFLLFLLLINPTIKTTSLQNVKPILSVLIDNSQSISFFKDENNSQGFVKNIKNDNEINKKFDVKYFSFGSKLSHLDSLIFSDSETNISKAISAVNELNSKKNAPIVLLTDGNQTIGNDYEFINSKQKIYPVVFGDTIEYKDLKISQLNVNKYSFIKNKFPVEVLINYKGKDNVVSRFSITKKGKTVFSKRVKFSSTNNSKTITTNLTSAAEGLQYYTASIKKLKGEKNIKNNTKNFSVEVIDEQTKVLILTDVLHPDLGAFKKAIESNKQRTVAIFKVDNFKGQLKEYQLVILYQPNGSFKSIFDKIKKNNSNYFLVSGSFTDWNFINKQQERIIKKAINKTESYSAIFNTSFLTFLQKDIGFIQFPPLKDKFGDVVLSKDAQTLLWQSIKGLKTKQPLISVSESNNQKIGVLFGEGFWKWRAASFLKTNSFIDFDEFVGNLVQYLASNKKRNRLEINSESIYPSNSTINISAFYTDKNYKFDARASLEITITNNKTNKILKFPFSLINNSYQSEIENLTSGDYSYKVTVIGQNINKYGKFKITDYKIEEQFTNANPKKLLKLAYKTGGSLFYKTEVDKLKASLLENKLFYTTQKMHSKEQSLIDWRWILILVLILLSLEWFIRKYYGKI
jgi:hypothetical protein